MRDTRSHSGSLWIPVNHTKHSRVECSIVRRQCEYRKSNFQLSWTRPSLYIRMQISWSDYFRMLGWFDCNGLSRYKYVIVFYGKWSLALLRWPIKNKFWPNRIYRNKLTVSVPEPTLCLYANRLDPGQPPSYSATCLRSNLFTTQTIIPNKKTSRN